MHQLHICLLGIALLGSSSLQAADYVWWEGEKPSQTNFPEQSWFAASTFQDKRNLLSGDDWLSASGKRQGEEAFAIYQLDVPADGEYHLWTRKFWQHGPFKWRFGPGEWRVCDRNIALADSVTLKTHVVANWVSLGKVKLAKGRQTFELRLLAGPGEDLTSAFDCFVLTPSPFIPNGRLKPDERSNKADEGFFAFEPPLDHFGAEALLDLRSLNEKTAGERGFLQRKASGFALGDGRPVRFWAVNIGANNTGQDRSSIDYLARKLAKLGVNMVRIHGTPFTLDTASSPQTLNRIDNLHYAVSAFKKEGIYTHISFYFPLWFNMPAASGYTGSNKHPFAIIYFDPAFQNLYKSWAKRLLDAKNPYTGLTLAQDPAVGIVELVNEDSFFFWTFTRDNIPAPYWSALERQFAQWLVKQYPPLSLRAILAGYGAARVPSDDPAANIAGLYPAWDMTRAGIRAGGRDKEKRIRDQVRFLTEMQRGFYANLAKYLKDDLKVGGLVSASNWKTADSPLLDAIERYTYAAVDVIDHHGYFGGEHKGEGSAYSVRVGHTYKDAAAVLSPESLPIQVVHVDGRPLIISEVGWTNPNRYRADATLLASAYSALQGTDGVFFFSVGSNYMRDSDMAKFALSCPAIAGTFPATALLYRRGDVKEAEPVVYQALPENELFSLKPSGISTADALDELRRRDVPPGGVAQGQVSNFDPLSYYVGPIFRSFDKPASASFQRDTSKHIDRQNKTIRSLTGELNWDYGNGLLRIQAQRIQAAAGFLAKARRIDLADISIECNNEFASIVAIALDDQPLATSKKILIQAMTEEQPYGYKAPGGQIADLGQSPLGVRKIDARLTLKNASGSLSVVALDENGYEAKRPVTVEKAAGNASIRLAPDSIYHIVRR